MTDTLVGSHVGLRLAVLGPVLVEDRAGALIPVAGALSRGFLVALVLARGAALTTEALIDALWGDDPPRGARAALQTLVSRLRRTVADGLVVSTEVGYRLVEGTGTTDLVRIEDTAVSSAGVLLDGDPAAAATTTAEALALWRAEPGDDLDGRLGEELAARAGTARRALRRVRAEALVATDHCDEAVRIWEDEAATAPYDEAAVTGRMRALDAAGRQAEALAVFAAHRERLAEDLGADPSADLVRLNGELLRRSAAATTRVRRIGLRVAATPLIGRDAAVAALSALVDRHRLVTVLGPGGLGKTRLAQEVARALPAHVAVVVVELAPLGDGADIVPTLGALLGIAEVRSLRVSVADLRSRVTGVLGEQPTVLVLDNCEHIVADVADLVADLLATLPDLRVLTTSRAPLAIAGEVVAPLDPLPVEADGSAVRLFTERARAARPGAVLPVDTVRRICTRLDGSPLAIELAAARIRGMGIDDIERRLDDRFALLRGGDRSAPERHRTLLAVIEWSWRLLGAGARDLLTRLALFPDGVGLDAVEAVAAVEATAFDDLAELVEQSLVQLTEAEDQPGRYRLLETVREFGAAQLAAQGRTDDVRAVMLRWGAAFAAGREVLHATDQYRVFEEVERESDTLVTLLRWALRSMDRPAVAHLFAALGSYWSLRGAQQEVAAVGAEVVALLARYDPEPEARRATVVSLLLAGATGAFGDRRTTARVVPALRRIARSGTTGDALLDAQAALLMRIGRSEAALALLATYRDDRDPRVAAFALTVSVPLVGNEGRTDRAIGYARRAEALVASSGDLWTTGTIAVALTQMLAQDGQPRAALATADIARVRLERFGADDDLSELGWLTGLAAAAVGDVVRARALADELAARPAVERSFEGDGDHVRCVAMAIRAEAARSEGDLETAATEYALGRDHVLGLPRRAPLWTVTMSAACIAIAVERSVDEASRSGGRVVRLPADGAERDIARTLRVAALVMLRFDPWWLDLPVIGAGLTGLALWGAATGGLSAADLATTWGLLVRLGARQDMAVLDRGRARHIVGAVVGEAGLADAETASAGLDRAEAVAATRALLERIRVPRG